jgi:creatinine amidohydrolase
VRSETEESIGRHAGISDTSQMLYIAPQYIRKDKLANRGGFEGSRASGDPSRASAEYGKKGVELEIQTAVAKIRELVAQT